VLVESCTVGNDSVPWWWRRAVLPSPMLVFLLSRAATSYTVGPGHNSTCRLGASVNQRRSWWRISECHSFLRFWALGVVYHQNAFKDCRVLLTAGRPLKWRFARQRILNAYFFGTGLRSGGGWRVAVAKGKHQPSEQQIERNMSTNNHIVALPQTLLLTSPTKPKLQTGSRSPEAQYSYMAGCPIEVQHSYMAGRTSLLTRLLTCLPKTNH